MKIIDSVVFRNLLIIILLLTLLQIAILNICLNFDENVNSVVSRNCVINLFGFLVLG